MKAVKTTFVGGVNPFLGHPDQPTAVLQRRPIAKVSKPAKPAKPAKLSKKASQKILALLAASDSPMQAKQIAIAVNVTQRHVSALLSRLYKQNLVIKTAEFGKSVKWFLKK